MVVRVLSVLFVLAAVALFTSTVVRADDQQSAHEGTVVSVTANKIVMKSKAKDGQEAEEHSHTLAADAKVTCDGKACMLEDLKPGQKVRVTTKKDDKTTAVRIEALDKNESFPIRRNGDRDR